MTQDASPLSSGDASPDADASVPAIQFRHVRKAFSPSGDAQLAVSDVSFSVPAGQFVSIVGPSGCGKSTLLTMASGILPTTAGEIRIGGRPVTSISREIGYLFQKDTLLPWKTVFDAVALPLRFRGLPKGEINDRVDYWLARVGLKGFEQHYPHQLSGGMRKRVSLAAVFVYDPMLQFMDEPFSSLDAQMKILMQNMLIDIWDEKSKSVLFVTHDLEEAIALSDRVIVMTARPGRIKSDYPIRLERPRDIASIRFRKEFTEQYEAIWQDLSSEVLAAYRLDEASR